MKKNIFKRIETERKLPKDLKDELLEGLASLEKGLSDTNKTAEKLAKKKED